MFLLFAAQPHLFAQTAPLPFCAEWLEKRDAKKETQEAKPELTAEDALKREKAKARRGEEREKKVAEGLRELELWLRDLTRQGLATAQAKPASYWENAAKRLIDAQAPGAARLLRDISATTQHEARLEKLGRLFLLLEAYKRLPDLPLAVQTDVKTAVGFTVKEDELSDENNVTDVWQVVGQEIYDEDKLRVLRTWLRGKNTGRDAMILGFAAPGQTLKLEFRVSAEVSAQLVFYPGNFPLRAAVKQLFDEPREFAAPAGYADAQEFLDSYSEALARNPWLETFPAVFRAVVPVALGEKAFLQDREGRLIPLAWDASSAGKFIAMSGGQEIAFTGTWNGETLYPLVAWAEGHAETYLHLANWAKAK